MTLRGVETRFLAEVKEGALLALKATASTDGVRGSLPKAFKVKVDTVVSDVELTLRAPPKDRGGPLPEFASTDGVRYGAKIIPSVDQSTMYSAVVTRLAQGGCVGIFPEGGSHDRTKLLTLKVRIFLFHIMTGLFANFYAMFNYYYYYYY